MRNRKAFLESVGCFIVQTETNHIAAYLNGNGYQLVGSLDDADIIILTTCAFNQERADLTYRGIHDYLARRVNNTPIYVVGCFTRIESKRMKELMEQHENVFAVEEVRDLEGLIKGDTSWDLAKYNDFFDHPYFMHMTQLANSTANWKSRAVTTTLSIFDSIFGKELLSHYTLRHIPYNLFAIKEEMRVWPVIASKGCTHNCSYCAVRIGRGKYRSKPASSILDEIRLGAKKGYKRIMLMGEELGSYGVELKNQTSLPSLLQSIISENLPVQVGLWYTDCFELPKVYPKLEALAARDKLFFIGIPFQSGSKRILELMNRHYSLDDSIEMVSKLRQFSRLIIATIFMVGFPTETENDFLASAAVAEKGYFDNGAVYCYSPRPGTAAAKMNDSVPQDIKIDRQRRLEEILDRNGKKRLLKYMFHELAPQLRSKNGKDQFG